LERARLSVGWPATLATAIATSSASLRKFLYHPHEVLTMSFRNGDKSREHRQRKAREKKRETIRGLAEKAGAKTQAAPASGKK
jgi:hypothetical protein